MTANVSTRQLRMSAVMILAGWALLITGCATMDKDACLNADWRTIGFEDGARGLAATHIGRHRQACAEYGVSPDLNQYQQGRRQGLVEWCTPRNGYRIGKAGGRYDGICPSGLEPQFLQALEDGRQEYDLNRQIDSRTRQLSRLIRELDILEQDLAGAEEELVRPGIGPRRRRQLLEQLRALEIDREALLADISSGEQGVDAARSQLEQARLASPYR